MLILIVVDYYLSYRLFHDTDTVLQHLFIYSITNIFSYDAAILLPWIYTIKSHWNHIFEPCTKAVKKNKIDYSLIF